jgi:hypothetical protein
LQRIAGTKIDFISTAHSPKKSIKKTGVIKTPAFDYFKKLND